MSIEDWIPVEEKMPEDVLRRTKYINVLVTKNDGKVTSCKRFRWDDGVYDWMRGTKVVAWMPLPKGYVPKENADE